jgi:hypothetical protein
MMDKDKAASLSREIAYPSGGEVPHHRISIDPDAFGSITTIISESPQRTDKKLNLRVRKEDNFFLKALAKRAGVSNSTMLNRLLHDLLLDALLSIEEEDARALLATAADTRASYDGFERPWCVDVGGCFSNSAIKNALEWNDLTAQDVQPPDLEAYGMKKADLHSDLFNELTQLLEKKQ